MCRGGGERVSVCVVGGGGGKGVDKYKKKYIL